MCVGGRFLPGVLKNRDYFLQLWVPQSCHCRSNKNVKTFSERFGANEVSKEMPGDCFFQLTMLSGGKMGSVICGLGRP